MSYHIIYILQLSKFSIQFCTMKKEPTNYKEHKALFEKIKIEERPDWTKKMLEIEQKKGQYPVYHNDFPHHGKWKKNGCELHYYYHINKTQPSKAILFYFPGMNSTGNSSAYFTMALAESCHVDVYSFDYKNFGRSQGQDRGLIESSQSLVQQSQQFVNFIMGQQKDKKKVFISGLSMGGGICFKLAIRNPSRYDGVIFLSPSLRQNKQAQPFMKKVGKFIGTLFPRLKLVEQSFTSGTKFNQEERILKDEFMYKDKTIPGSVRVILNMMQQIEKEWEKFTHPFIFIQSGVDKMVDPFQAIDFEKECKSNDKTVYYWKDMWHVVFAQDQLPQVIEAVRQWLQPRTNK